MVFDYSLDLQCDVHVRVNMNCNWGDTALQVEKEKRL